MLCVAMDLPSREGKAESAAWVRGTPAVYRGGFFDYLYATATTPRTGGTESDTSRNYRDGRAVRYE